MVVGWDRQYIHSPECLRILRRGTYVHRVQSWCSVLRPCRNNTHPIYIPPPDRGDEGFCWPYAEIYTPIFSVEEIRDLKDDDVTHSTFQTESLLQAVNRFHWFHWFVRPDGMVEVVPFLPQDELRHRRYGWKRSERVDGSFVNFRDVFVNFEVLTFFIWVIRWRWKREWKIKKCSFCHWRVKSLYFTFFRLCEILDFVKF